MSTSTKTRYLFFPDFNKALGMASRYEERGFDTTLEAFTLNDGTKGFMISWTVTDKSLAYAAAVVYNTFSQLQEKK